MLALTLKVLAPFFILAGALHLLLGLNADILLGANLSATTINDPVLDSQNRFYGTAFMLYGVLLYLCATDIKKYSAVFKCVMWVFFAAGVARLISMTLYGMPPVPVLVLTASELLMPPLLLGWLSIELRRS